MSIRRRDGRGATKGRRMLRWLCAVGNEMVMCGVGGYSVRDLKDVRIEMGVCVLRRMWVWYCVCEK
jgi:hypothetical protein